MNSRILTVVLLCALCFHASAREERPVVMTLDECLDYAYEHNEELIIANLEKSKQEANVGEVMSEGLPQINASADFRKNFQLRTTFVPAIFFDPNAQEGEFAEVTFGTAYEGDIGLNLSQMVFDGSYFVGLQAAKTFKELTNKAYIKSRTDVAEAVSKAYYSVLVSEERLRLIELNFSRLDSLLRETRIMYENGFVERIDLSRTQVEFNNIKAQLENQKRLVDYSKKLLKFQMGLPIDEEIEIADKPEDLKDIDYAAVLNNEMDKNRRIEYQQLQVRERLAQLDLKNNHMRYLPTIDLYFGMGMNAGTQESSELFSVGGDSWFDYRYAGLKLSIPIFDGLRKSHKIQQNRVELQQIRNQFNQLEKSINLEISNARTSLVNSINELRNQQENMELAEEVYNVSKTKYQEGVGSSIELIEADNAYKQAQTNYNNALLQALLAKIDYEKALGILLD